MKIIVFKGGLGNQLFQYLFALKLLEQGYKVFYIDGTNNDHNGLEIFRYFKCVDSLIPLNLIFQHFYNWCRTNCNFPLKLFRTDDIFFKKWKLIYDGYWQDKKYFEGIDLPKFKYIDIGKRNQTVFDIINSSNSVFIHVRRGDYLSPENYKIYGNICTVDYYNKAISIVKEKVPQPIFFCFSNDIDWVKKNLPLNNCFYIDWNSGKNSIFDLFLMSNCKYAIIANSSFSYWGAKLNGNKSLVIYPKKWFNTSNAPAIFQDNWLAL